MTTRTRFAPSPTGYLHLGGARTALFSWAYARKKSGDFILRIEDTDQERSTKEAINAILEAMDWLKLNYDEGPVYQTDRLERYKKIAEELIASGKAYRCYCSKERIDALREGQLKEKAKPRYDGCCRDKNLPHKDEPHVIRFKNPKEGSVSFVDEVNGEITIQNSELDDLVIIRSDGYPTYNFCVVIDDMDMDITHVIRGTDHINNTPRQINIFKALGAKIPTFAHVPMILGNDGTKLSKRHGAVSVMQYRDEGFLREAFLNCLVRLGWSHGDQEIFSREEIINLFDIHDVNKSAAAFDPEKLLWLNRHYIKTLDPVVIAEQLQWHLSDLKIDLSDGPEITEVIKAFRERVETLRELAVKCRFFYEEFNDYEESSKKHLTPEIKVFMEAARHRLDVLGDWTKENLHQIIEDVAKEFELKMGKVAQPIRVAVTGTTVSPPIDITLQLLGRRKVLLRLDRVIKSL